MDLYEVAKPLQSSFCIPSKITSKFEFTFCVDTLLFLKICQMLEKLDLSIISLVENTYKMEIQGKYLSSWKGNFNINFLSKIRYWIVIGLYFSVHS